MIKGVEHLTRPLWKVSFWTMTIGGKSGWVEDPVKGAKESFLKPAQAAIEASQTFEPKEQRLSKFGQKAIRPRACKTLALGQVALAITLEQWWR